MSLAEFLLARIAEDEQRAADTQADLTPEAEAWEAVMYLVAERAIADADAKRRIVEQAKPMHLHDGPADWWFIRELAAPYADHPDYRQEWKPRD